MKLYKYYSLNTNGVPFTFGSYLKAEVEAQQAIDGGHVDRIWVPSAPDASTYSPAEMRLIESKAQVMEL